METMATTDSANGNGKPGKLLPQHLADLRRSDLSDVQIAACHFTSLTDPAVIARYLGWKRAAQGLGPCLGIPFFDAAGKLTQYVRVKPDRPRVNKEDGKPIKYESPLKQPNRAYFPPGTWATLADPSVPLIITEGEKKAAKADQDGFPCVGLVGVYGWQRKRRDKDKEAPRELIPDLEGVAWQGRGVYVCYDSDLADKPEVAWAEWRLAEVLTAKGAVVQVVRLPAGPEGAKVGLDDFLVANGPDDFRKMLDAAKSPKRPEDSRPEIELGPLEFLSVGQAVEALARHDHDLYQRGGQLVRIVRAPRPATRHGLTTSGAPRIELLPTANLRTRLTCVARIVQIVQKKDSEPEKVPAHPPGWLVQGVDAAGSWPGVRPLEAVVTSPVLLADGTVLQHPGYHADSGLLYLPEPDADYQPVPERPTHGDVVRARDALLEVVCDFPFAGEEHKAAWLAGVLTPLARFAFNGPAPLFLIDANVRSAGKGLLADAIARIASGREFARAAYTTDDDEMRKVITAIALEGEQLVLLDNLAGVLGNPCLDAALTAT